MEEMLALHRVQTGNNIFVVELRLHLIVLWRRDVNMDDGVKPMFYKGLNEAKEYSYSNI